MSAAAAPHPFYSGPEEAPSTGGAADEGPGALPSSDAPAPAGAAGSARPMNLLCSLGRHTPRAAPRWNDGYYFATCRRCGRDIVRTAYEGWHVPRGYRVVWAPAPPEDRPAVSLTPAAPAPAPPEPAEREAVSLLPQLPEPDDEAPHEALPAESAPAGRKRQIGRASCRESVSSA